MIHISDITHEQRLEHPKDVLKENQRVRAVVVELDRERRRIRLSMKQLEPTTADEYIAEHKVGDVVTGRLVDVSSEGAKVELGEGVYGFCRIPKPDRTGAGAGAAQPASDISTLSKMLAARWKQGASPVSASVEAPRAGQIRSLRITGIDPAQKKIELELAN